MKLPLGGCIEILSSPRVEIFPRRGTKIRRELTALPTSFLIAKNMQRTAAVDVIRRDQPFAIGSFNHRRYRPRGCDVSNASRCRKFSSRADTLSLVVRLLISAAGSDVVPSF